MASQDYYSDAAPAPESAPAEPKTEKVETDESATAELPKTVLGGKDFKPGEEVVLEIVDVREDSVLVKYATGKEEEEPSPTEESTPSDNPGGGMSSMMY